MVNVKIANPPDWLLKEIKEKFGIFPGIVYAYDDIIYNPDNIEIPYDLLEHETTHLRRQHENGATPESWWRDYLNEPIFRLREETEAYKAQYRAIKDKVLNRSRRHRELNELAKKLSSPLYGNLVSFVMAMQLIKS